MLSQQVLTKTLSNNTLSCYRYLYIHNMNRCTLIALILMSFLSVQLQAQDTLKGKIFDVLTDSVISTGSIFNQSRNETVQAAADGSYLLFASEGDIVIFSSIGYKADTVKILYYMLRSGYDVSLKPLNNYLPGITIRGYAAYQADSIARRNHNKDLYDNPPKNVTGGNRPTDGVGISVSPISYFSKKEKERRKAKKMAVYEEEQAYIDFRFSKSYVERTTGLHDDSLQTFMLKYRPSHDFCRKSNNEDMLLYINEKLKEFLRPKK
jgi:hypothetical protein